MAASRLVACVAVAAGGGAIVVVGGGAVEGFGDGGRCVVVAGKAFDGVSKVAGVAVVAVGGVVVSLEAASWHSHRRLRMYQQNTKTIQFHKIQKKNYTKKIKRKKNCTVNGRTKE